MSTSTHNAGQNLYATGLLKDFGAVRALAGVDISIPAGQSVAIMGPSGSGKSTLLHCLSGILPPTKGRVILGDQSFSELSDAKRSKMRLERFGFVFQDGQLVPELTARENVAVPLMLRRTPKRQALRIADEWLARLGLYSEAARRPGQMSGGQAQRVAIARAIAGSPAVIFADEPTGALDQATGHEVMQVLTTAAKSQGSTFVVVTHDPQVAAWCDRRIEIRDGRIHADSALPPAGGQPQAQGQAQGQAGTLPMPAPALDKAETQLHPQATAFAAHPAGGSL